MKTLQKNNVLIVILFAIAVLMSVGFAVLSTTLNINGTAKVKASSWDIHFENVVISEGSSEAIKEAVIANEDATLVEYEVELEKPGDFYEFTVDAVNEGTLDSMIEMVTLSGIEGNEDYVSYQATYLSGEEIKIGDALNASTSETYKIRIEYKKDIENLPSEDIKVSLVFGVTYSQSKDGEVITNYYTLTGTAYGADGLPLTGGEIEVHSKVVTSPINSDGTFILKNIPVGKHEIFIKDTTGNVINEGEFTLQTGDKTTIENNIVTANSTGNIELNIRLLESDVEIASICDYEVGQTWEFVYTGDIQEFNVPCQGTYELEVYGASGGGIGTSDIGGKGGYSSGNTSLLKDQKLYIAVGQAGINAVCSTGSDSYSNTIRTYNGGGPGTNKSIKSSNNACGGSGGGATHIAKLPGVLADLSENKESILIVAGGGGGKGMVFGWYGSNYSWKTETKAGGAGGGLTGINGSGASNNAGTGGTQAAGGTDKPYSGRSSFGNGGSAGYGGTGGAGGGGGYYGGGSGYWLGGGGGGSSYIDGVTDGETIAGNALMPTHDGTSTMTGNTGDGYAKITLVTID